MRHSSCNSSYHRSILYEEKMQRLSKRMQNIDRNINKIKMKSKIAEKEISDKKSYKRNASMFFINKMKKPTQFNNSNPLARITTTNSNNNKNMYLTNCTKYNQEFTSKQSTQNNSFEKEESQINEIKSLKNKLYRLQYENKNLSTKLYTLKNNNDMERLNINSKNEKIIKGIMELYNYYFLEKQNTINEVSLADILMNILKLKYKYENSLLFNEFLNGMNNIMNDYSGSLNIKDEFGIYYFVKDLLQMEKNLIILKKNSYKENEDYKIFLQNSMNNLNTNNFDEFRNKLNSVIKKNKKDEEKLKIVEQVLLTEKSETDFSINEMKKENGSYNDFYAKKIDNVYESKISENLDKYKYKDKNINGKETNDNFDLYYKKRNNKLEISKSGDVSNYHFRHHSFKNNC